MAEAFESVFGRSGSLRSGHAIAGKTDRQIVREVAAEIGLDPAEEARKLALYWDEYVARLAANLAERGAKPYPGVMELLDALATRPGVEIALLTGNMERGAWLKIEAAGLAGRFRWGAFGDECGARRDLVPVALERAREATGRIVAPNELVLVGDTPEDISTARSGGARVLAVATGIYPLGTLREHAPDHLFTDLTNTAAVVAALMDGRPA